MAASTAFLWKEPVRGQLRLDTGIELVLTALSAIWPRNWNASPAPNRTLACPGFCVFAVRQSATPVFMSLTGWCPRGYPGEFARTDQPDRRPRRSKGRAAARAAAWSNRLKMSMTV